MNSLDIGSSIQVCEDGGSETAQIKLLGQGLGGDGEPGAKNFGLERLVVRGDDCLFVELGDKIELKSLQ